MILESCVSFSFYEKFMNPYDVTLIRVFFIKKIDYYCTSLNKTTSMKKLLLGLILFLSVTLFQLSAQKHEFIFYTRNGDILVFLNNQFYSRIEDKTKFSVSVVFDEQTPTNTITLSRKGYEKKEFVYDSKPEKRSTKVFWAMQKERFKLNGKNELTFDLAKVKFDVPSSQDIFQIPRATAYWNWYWSNTGISECGKAFSDGIQEELRISGFICSETDQNSDDNLFDESTKQKSADISVGAIIKDMKVKGHLFAYDVNVIYNQRIEMEVDWQFYDNNSKKLLSKVTTQAESYMVKESGRLIPGLTMAFNQNFAEALKSPEVIKQITSVDSEAEKTYKENVLKEYSIESHKPQVYDTYGKMIKMINPSVVTLKGSNGHGSGFVISEQGYIITNYHVVKGNSGLKALFQMGFELPVEILNYSEEFDLALLKVMGSGFNALSISEKQPEIGDEVIAIGTPNSTQLSNTVTKGIISGKRTNDKGVEFIQTDVSVSPGNSGGPLINSKGMVVGIISQKLIEVGTDGIAFAIPINYALDKLNIKLK